VSAAASSKQQAASGKRQAVKVAAGRSAGGVLRLQLAA
jgi:hypothetical protein